MRVNTIVLAVAMTMAGVGQNPAPPAPTAAISGVVLDSVTQKPLAGAIVVLNAVATPMLGGPAAPQESQTIRTTTNAAGQVISTDLPRPEAFRAARQITDELGRFVFIALPGGMSYALTATKFGYFDGSYGRKGVPGNVGTSRRIALVDGQWFRDARIELVQPASINGRVVDETGDPVVGVMVRAYTEIFVGGTRQVASGLITTTDDRGEYRIPGLPTGRYIVAVPSVQHAIPADTETTGNAAQSRQGVTRTNPEFAIDPAHRLVVMSTSPPPAPSASGRPQVYPLTFYPASRTLVDASAIQLQPGEERQAVDFQLRAVPAFRISGRLDGPADAISGLSLRLLPAGSESLGRGSEAATSFVAVDGSFTFLNVPSGAYTIIANRSVTEYSIRPSNTSGVVDVPTAPGARTTSMSSGAVESGPPGTMFSRYSYAGNQRFQARQSVAVGGSDIADIVVPLQAGVSVQGTFVFESSKPDPGPRGPILGVRAEPANGDSSLGQPQASRLPNNPSLDFTLEGLLPGAYLIRLMGGGGTVKSITWNGKDYTDTPFDTTGGRDITGVVITLTDQVTTLSGTIRDRNGQPAANTAVIVFPAERAQWTNFGLQPTRVRASPGSTGGTYSLRLLPAGEYLAVAVDDELAGRWKDPSFLESASRVATRLTLAWGESKRIDLTLQEIR